MIVDPSIREAYNDDRVKAEDGDADAQYKMAAYYKDGFISPYKPGEMLSWLEKAAEQGHAAALDDLYGIYEDGEAEGIERNKMHAYQWLDKGASHGTAGSLYELGLVLYSSQGGTEKPVLLWKKAADKGSEKALKALSEAGVTYKPAALPDNDLRDIQKIIDEALKIANDAAMASLRPWTEPRPGRDDF